MTRRYQTVWQEIAKRTEPTKIKVSVKFQATFIKAIRKEKSLANVLRRNLGMPEYGDLRVTQDALDKSVLVFEMDYNGDHL